MTPANRPPPDFYRIAMGKGEQRRWLKGFSFGHNPGVPEFTYDLKAAAQAATFMFETEANEALAKARMHMPTAGLHVVPVRVKVTKVPRQHDFAWALKLGEHGRGFVLQSMERPMFSIAELRRLSEAETAAKSGNAFAQYEASRAVSAYIYRNRERIVAMLEAADALAVQVEECDEAVDVGSVWHALAAYKKARGE